MHPSTLAHNKTGQRAPVVERSASRLPIGLSGLVGTSPALAHALSEAAIVANHDISVLFTGEPGTGKTLLARALHRISPRADGPFVEVSCPNLPPTLLENELFGRERGAYTDAGAREAGKVAAAEGGTLFLDEIGELPLSAQPKLLMLLNDKVYFPLGAQTPRKANVRILAATNQELGAAIAAGRFRRDLYDRVSEMAIEMPALRQRREDLESLAQYFVDEACKRYRLMAMEAVPETLRQLRARSWPGNLRELRNHLRIAVLRADSEGTRFIQPNHVFPSECPSEEEPVAAPTLASAARDAQRDLLADVLRGTRWNVAATARKLSASRSHVNKLISDFGLERPRSVAEQIPVH